VFTVHTHTHTHNKQQQATNKHQTSNKQASKANQRKANQSRAKQPNLAKASKTESSKLARAQGTDAVIGWSRGDGSAHIGDYYLGAQVDMKVRETNKQGLRNTRVIRKAGQLALQFERPLIPPNGDGAYVFGGPLHVIVAFGPMPSKHTNLIPYHRFRYSAEVTFIQGKRSAGVPLAVANRARPGELCGGPEDIICKDGLKCVLFDQIKTDAPNPFGEEGQTAGLCFKQKAVGEDSAVKSIVNQSDYEHSLDLGKGFRLYWTVQLKNKGKDRGEEEGSIKIAFTSRTKKAWLGLGFSPSNGGMVGARTAVGWVPTGAGDGVVKDFLLFGKLPWSVTETQDQELRNTAVVTQDGAMGIFFERPLKPKNGIEIKAGTNSVIWAVGHAPEAADEYFGYHRYRHSRDITFFLEE